MLFSKFCRLPIKYFSFFPYLKNIALYPIHLSHCSDVGGRKSVIYTCQPKFKLDCVDKHANAKVPRARQSGALTAFACDVTAVS